MNKNLHRIIFNANRGQLMVVAESATAQGKDASGERGASSSGAESAAMGMATRAGGALRSICLGVLASLGGAVFTAGMTTSMSAQAQIIADPTAPGGQRPTVLNSANGVPVVNIQTPSAAGVSRNTYRQFDVNSNGAILNNSRTNVQTQLGGFVQGNPWLATGTARVILNEVNSSNPSQLRGYIEVGGQRAEVVVANPAGVSIDGAGFINASRVTITTGSAVVNGGSLEGYLVERGQVTVDGKGLDTSSADYTAILARAVQVNGGIWARQLRVTTGANQLRTAEGGEPTVVGAANGQGPAPLFALDVSQLGGMYAGKILLIGTEAGVGVRNAGQLIAGGAVTPGTVFIDSKGWLSNSGLISSAAGTQLRAQDAIDNSGKIQTDANVQISTPSSLTNSGSIEVAGRIDTDSDSLNNSGRFAALQGVRLQATQVARNSGKIVTAGELDLTSQQVDNRSGEIQAARVQIEATGLDNRQGRIWQSGSQNLNLQLGELQNATGQIGNAIVTPAGLADPAPSPAPGLSPGTVPSPGTEPGPLPEGNVTPVPTPTFAAGQIRVAQLAKNDAGTIAGNGNVDLSVAAGLSNGGSISVGNFQVRGANFNNDNGKVIADIANVQVQTATNVGGQFSGRDVTLSANSLNNTRGQMVAREDFKAQLSEQLTNTLGRIVAGHDLTVEGSAALNNQSGLLQSQTGTTRLVLASADNTQGAIIAASGLQLQATDLNNTRGQINSAADAALITNALDNTGGTIRSEGNLNLRANGALLNQDENTSAASITASGNNFITATSIAGNGLLGSGLLNDGTLVVTPSANTADLVVVSQGAVAANGQNISAGNLTVNAVSIDLGRSVTSAQNITLTANQSDVVTSGAQLTAGSKLEVIARQNDTQAWINTNGKVSADQIAVQVANLSNTGGGQIVQTGNADQSLVLTSVGGLLDNNAGTIASNAANLTLQAGSLSNQQGLIQHAGGGNLTASAVRDVNTAGGSIVSAGNLAVTAANIDHRGATTQAQRITVNAGNLDNRGGSIAQVNTAATGGMQINLTGQLDNSAAGSEAGLISANADININASNVINRGGRIQSASLTTQAAPSRLRITSAAEIDNRSGVLQSSGDLALQTNGLRNDAGQISSGADVVVSATGSITNIAGSVVSATDLLLSAGQLNNQEGLLASASGNLTATVQGGLNNSSGLIQAAGVVRLDATGLSNSNAAGLSTGGRIAGSDLLLNAGDGVLNNTQGSISATGTLNVVSGPLINNAGLIQAGGSSSLNTGNQQLLNQDSGAFAGFAAGQGLLQGVGQGGIYAGGSLTLASGALDNSQGKISADQNISLVTGAGLTNSKGQITAGGQLAVTASGTLNNDQGQIAADGQVQVSASSLINTRGDIYSAEADLTLTTQGQLNNSQQGLIQAAGAMQIRAGQLDNNSGSLASQGSLTIQASSLSNDRVDGTAALITTDQNLSITTLGATSNQGSVISAGGQLSLSNSALSSSGTIYSTGNQTISSTGSVSNSGTIAAEAGVNIQAQTITSTQGAVLAAGLNSEGRLVGQAGLSLNAQSALVAQGQNLASGRLMAQGASLDLSGSQTSAQNIDLVATSGDITTGNNAQIVASEQLSIQANANSAQSLNNSNQGVLSAERLQLQVANINNSSGGQITQTGSADLTVQVTGQINNSAGLIEANSQNLQLQSASLNNQAGTVQHAGQGNLIIQSTGQFNNSNDGLVLSNGALQVTAASLNNDNGALRAAGTPGNTTTGNASISVLGALSNIQGRINAAQDLSVVAGTAINNVKGQITAGGQLGVSTAGQLANDEGRIVANGNAQVSAASLINTRGEIYSANADLTVTSQGFLNNSQQGLMQAAGNVRVNAGQLDNSSGSLAAQGNLVIQATSLDNSSGTVLSDQNVNITTTAGLNNQQGKIQALGDIAANVGTTLDNRAGIIRSNGAVTLAAALLDNRNTYAGGADNTKGIDGKNITITTSAVDNSQGRAFADDNLIITASNSVNNTLGTLYAGNTLRIQDSAALANNRTLVVTNTGGKIAAGQLVELAADRIVGADRIESGNDLSLNFVGDYTHAAGAQYNARRNANLTVSGNLLNQGLIQAGNVLTLGGTNITNDTSGEINAQQTRVTASDTRTNRGLIDGVDTQVTAGTLNNVGSGRIYGDSLSIQAGTLNNSAENGQAATIAARGQLDVGVQTLNNTGGASLFSAGDLSIGGSLDANRRATGSAVLINNASSDIEALGNASISTQRLNNLNTQFAYRLVDGVPITRTEYIIGSTTFRESDFAWMLTTPGIRHQFQMFAGKGFDDLFYRETFLRGAAYTPGMESCDTGDTGICYRTPNTFSYTAQDPVWARLGVAPPTGPNPGAPPSFRNVCDYYGDNCTQVPPSAEEVAAYNALLLPWTTLNSAITTLRINMSQFITQIDHFRVFTDVTQTYDITASRPGRIVAGGNLNLRATDTLTNNNSQIIAGNLLSVTGAAVTNETAQIPVTSVQNGTTLIINPAQRGNCMNTLANADCWWYVIYDQYAYNITTPRILNIDVSRVQGFTAVQNGTAGNAGAYNAPTTTTTPSGTAGTPQAGQLTTDNTGTTALAAAQTAAATSPTNSSTDPVQNGVSQALEVTNVQPNVVGRGTLPGSTPPIAVKPGAQAFVDAGAAPTGAAAPQAPADNASGIGLNQTRTVAPAVQLPSSSLFTVSTNRAGGYLVETDPRFASYRQWLSSDFILNALGIDPATTQKRLGDGFYEQKLIREQVAQLTGQRFLGNYTSDEDQYRALMSSAATQVGSLQLRPGIALSEAQMAALTSDIVWLVEREVTLADGTRTRALVPQVYVRTRAGDVDGTGALLAGRNVQLAMTGDVVTSGTVAGRNVTLISANNVRNLTGTIAGAQVGITAKQDIDNIGGSVVATNLLKLNAGRDINVTTTTVSSDPSAASRASNTGSGRNARTAQTTASMTQIDRVAGLYVTGADGQPGVLVASAGRDINLQGAVISNASVATSTQASTNAKPATSSPATSSTSGDGPTVQRSLTALSAGRDLNLTTVTTSLSIQGTNRGQRTSSSMSLQTSEETGTAIQSQGDIYLDAKQDIAIRAGQVQSSEGALGLSAGRDIAITEGRQTFSLATTNQSSSRSTFRSSSTNQANSNQTNTSVESSLGGRTIDLDAGRDIQIRGANVVSDKGTSLRATNNITIEAATNTSASSSFIETKRSGLMGSGGAGIFIGNKQQSTSIKTQETTSAGSTIAAISGNVNIVAGNKAVVQGSAVIAPGGDINILAKDIAITDAQNTFAQQTETRTRQTGITASVNSPILSAVQTLQSTAQAVSQTKDSRMQALGVAGAGLSLYNGASGISNAAGALASGNPTQAGSVSISLGSSRSQSNSDSQATTSAGSTVAAGGNINIKATGGGKDSNLLIQGSQVRADGDISLSADNAVTLRAGQNTSATKTSSSSSSASVGVTISATGVNLDVAASRTKGKGAGEDTTYSNTQVAAGNTLRITSGGDTTLSGAVASGNRTIANVGGNLTIESLQDRSTYAETSSSSGFSVSVPVYGAGSGPASASVNAGRTRINSNFDSVGEQSGLRAGNGGFQVSVANNTTLTGGVISSSQAAVDGDRNTFTTGGALSITDVQNSASFKGSAVGISAGYGGGKPTGSAGVGNTSGNASSTTTAGITGVAGNTAVRTGDAQTGLKPIFDADRVRQEINAQVAITQAFSREAPRAVATFSTNQINDLKVELAKENDPTKQTAIKAEIEKWEEGGRYRVLLHTAAGAFSGGVSGAAGAAVSASAAPLMNQLQDDLANGLQNAGVSTDIARVIASGIAGLTAAGVGAVVGGTQGAATAFTVDTNNRQLHPTEVQIIKQNAARYAKIVFGTQTPTPAQIEAATIMLVNTAQNAVDNNMGVALPYFKEADNFLQTLKIEYYQNNATLNLPGTSGTQQLFYASVEQMNSPALNQGLADPLITGLIVRTPLTSVANNPTSDPTRDRITGLPLDDKGRYQVQVSLDDKNFSLKYFPCATTDCIQGGKNLDISDPGTQAYLKASDKKIFDDINKASNILAIVSPLGAAGNVALYAGPLSSIASGIVDDQAFSALFKEGMQAAAGTYLQKVYGLTQAVSTRITSLIDLAGGWQAFVNRTKTELSKETK